MLLIFIGELYSALAYCSSTVVDAAGGKMAAMFLILFIMSVVSTTY